MSYGNSGDFDRGNQAGGQKTGGQNSGSPYTAGPGQSAPQKSNTLLWVLGILGVLTVGGALVCCGGGYFAYTFSTKMVADAVKSSISADPAIQEHIGTISDISMNLTATSAAGGGEKIVLDIKGDKGTGQIEVVMAGGDPNGQAVKSCVLVLPNGERIDLAIDPSGQMTSPNEAFDSTETDVAPTADSDTPDADTAEAMPVEDAIPVEDAPQEAEPATN